MNDFSKNNKQEDKRPLWFVKFPTYKYNQDVKDLAKKNNLRVIDVKFEGNYNPKRKAEKTPSLTIADKYKVVKKEEVAKKEEVKKDA